jgi:DNA-directed RNA polymerase subunit M/transcription elongation factor TFIIS
MMVTLTTVNWISEADLLCFQLESEGIKTFVPDQNTASVQPLYGNAIGGIRVQIDERDLPRAQEILKDSGLPAGAKGMFECPQCHSDSVRYEKVSKRFAFLSILLIGIPLLWFKRQCRCENCGHKWKEK